MSKFSKSFWLGALFMFSSLGFLSSAVGQEIPSRLKEELGKVDFGVSGIGSFTGTVSGTNYLGQNVTQQASNTLGALITVRYVRSPLVGFEGNVSYARYTENFNVPPLGGAQTRASEYTLGYVAHTREYFGLKPFGAIGLGSMEFAPTTSGGQGLPARARAAYYYAVGADAMISEHFGLRGQVRQVFFKAPDFGQNYLSIQQHTSTFEPGFGFFIKF